MRPVLPLASRRTVRKYDGDAGGREEARVSLALDGKASREGLHVEFRHAVEAIVQVVCITPAQASETRHAVTHSSGNNATFLLWVPDAQLLSGKAIGTSVPPNSGATDRCFRARMLRAPREGKLRTMPSPLIRVPEGKGGITQTPIAQAGRHRTCTYRLLWPAFFAMSGENARASERQTFVEGLHGGQVSSCVEGPVVVAHHAAACL